MKTVVTLIKNGQKKDFTERAAKIAVESFGWQQIIPLKVPAEIGTKTRPPEIRSARPIEPAVTPLKPVETKVTMPSGPVPEVKQPEIKKRKTPVRSKTTKK